MGGVDSEEHARLVDSGRRTAGGDRNESQGDVGVLFQLLRGLDVAPDPPGIVAGNPASPH